MTTQQAAERCERQLAALLDELARPSLDGAALHARTQSCADAFDALQAAGVLGEAELSRLRALLVQALALTQSELVATGLKLRAARSALRTARLATPQADPVGDWCDIAG